MRYTLVLAIITLIAGCSTAPEALLFENSRVFEKSRDDVWQNLTSFFESSSIPVKSKDKEKGTLLAVRKLKRASIYANCGTSDLASVENGTLTVKISVHSLGALKTRATIDVKFFAYRQYVGVAKSRIECFSNGTLEEEILKNL